MDVAFILEENRRFAKAADVTFLLEISVDTALERIRVHRSNELTPFEKRDDLKAVAAVYRDLKDPSLTRVDAGRSPEEIHHEIVQVLRNLQGCSNWLE